MGLNLLRYERDAAGGASHARKGVGPVAGLAGTFVFLNSADLVERARSVREGGPQKSRSTRLPRRGGKSLMEAAVKSVDDPGALLLPEAITLAASRVWELLAQDPLEGDETAGKARARLRDRAGSATPFSRRRWRATEYTRRCLPDTAASVPL